MATKKNDKMPVPKVARGSGGIKGSFGTGKSYAGVSSRKRNESFPVPKVGRSTKPSGGKTPGAGRVSPKVTTMAKSRDGGSTRHRNGR